MFHPPETPLSRAVRGGQVLPGTDPRWLCSILHVSVSTAPHPHVQTNETLQTRENFQTILLTGTVTLILFQV